MAIRLCKHFGKGILFLESNSVFLQDSSGARDISVPSYFLAFYLAHLLLNRECAKEVNLEAIIQQALYSFLKQIK